MRTDLAEEDFVGEGAVHVGGVEEGDPAAERLRDDGDAGLVVQRGVVRARQSHTPEPQLGHLHGWNQSAESIQSITGLADKVRGERREIKATSNPWVPSLTRGTGGAWLSMAAARR